MENITVNGKSYAVKKLLGKGKGGYSYLAEREGKEYVVKQIHHEPCAYYQFGNKLEAEKGDYERLRKSGIRIPELLEVDEKEERILKEYIEGPTIYELVAQEKMKDTYMKQVEEMSRRLYEAGLNIDYFPTNFIVQGEEIWYIDFECNSYMEEWNLENWGIRYWSKTPEFLEYWEEHKK